MSNLESALIRDGQPVDIERVEIEALENGSFRWKLWADGSLIHCAVGQRDDITGMLAATQVILQAMAGIYDEEIRTGTATEGGRPKQLHRSDRRNHPRAARKGR